jgi:hypothetical protein
MKAIPPQIDKFVKIPRFSQSLKKKHQLKATLMPKSQMLNLKSKMKYESGTLLALSTASVWVAEDCP